MLGKNGTDARRPTLLPRMEYEIVPVNGNTTKNETINVVVASFQTILMQFLSMNGRERTEAAHIKRYPIIGSAGKRRE